MTPASAAPATPTSSVGDPRDVRVDPQRVEQAFDRCSVALYRYFAMRVASTTTADDLMQQLWLQACKAPASIPIEEMEYWLRRVARNLLIDHWRRNSKRPAHRPLENHDVGVELARQVDAGVAPDVILEQKESIEQLQLAVTELSPTDQELMVQHYVHGRQFQEIGAALGMSERAVEGRLYRARQQLRRTLAHLEEDEH